MNQFVKGMIVVCPDWRRTTKLFPVKYNGINIRIFGNGSHGIPPIKKRFRTCEYYTLKMIKKQYFFTFLTIKYVFFEDNISYNLFQEMGNLIPQNQDTPFFL